MKFVPVVNCPNCNMPYTAAQLGHAFTVGPNYTVICGIHNAKGQKVGCGAAFDFQVVEVPEFEDVTKFVTKTEPMDGFWNKLRKKQKTITEPITERRQSGSHLEVKAVIRGA